jgi:beta-lactamase class A
MNRRTFIQAAVAIPYAVRSFALTSERLANSSFKEWEKSRGGRLGVFAKNTATGELITHRPDERFPMCSTMKLMLAAAVLDRAAREENLLGRRIGYNETDLVSWSPVTEKHVSEGMTVAQLCAAALQYSDNTAANLLIKLVGDPAAVTRYARSIGNNSFRLDRWETELNSCIPGDQRDTVSPAAMAGSMESLLLGDRLPPALRDQLIQWMLGNTTGDKRIRAAVPAGWTVADKTGSGAYGTTNDIGILFPDQDKPIILVIYHTVEKETARWNDSVVADATRIIVTRFLNPDSPEQ